MNIQEWKQLSNSSQRKQQPEYQLQKQLCNYLRSKYPDVLFLSDTKASVKLTMPQAQRNKALQHNSFKCPDLLILETKKSLNLYGLFLELKVESPFKKNGEIKASQDDHLKKQHESLLALIERGYYADFVWDYEEAKKIIDWYLLKEE